MAWATMCRPNTRGRAVAGQGGPGRVGGGQARAFGIARHGAALDIGQVLVQPVLALRQRLRMGQHGLDAVHGRLLAHQVVAHQQADFADEWQGVVQEQVQRARDDALGHVLHADDAELRAAAGRRVEDLVEVGAVGHVGRAAEILQRRLLAEGAAGPSTATRCGDSSARQADMISRQIGGHMLALQRAGVGRCGSCR